MIVPTTNVLENVVRAWIAEGSELDRKRVLTGNRDTPAPTGVYATVTPITDKRDGTPWSNVEPDGTVLTFESRTFKYSVQWYRDGGADRARAFLTWAGGPLGTTAATRHGITFRRASELRQMDMPVSGAWESRVGADLTVGVVTMDARPGFGSFEHVTLVVVPDTGPPRSVDVGP